MYEYILHIKGYCFR